jgi:glycerol uptake facilitator-like aquaporin
MFIKAISVSGPGKLGATVPTLSSTGQALLVEFIITSVLLFTVLSTAVSVTELGGARALVSKMV